LAELPELRLGLSHDSRTLVSESSPRMRWLGVSPVGTTGLEPVTSCL
jgi:hypothetical protein